MGCPYLWRAADLKNGDIEAVLHNLLADHPGITALIIPQEIGVPGLLKAVQASGLRMPEDLIHHRVVPRRDERADHAAPVHHLLPGP